MFSSGQEPRKALLVGGLGSPQSCRDVLLCQPQDENVGENNAPTAWRLHRRLVATETPQAQVMLRLVWDFQKG